MNISVSPKSMQSLFWMFDDGELEHLKDDADPERPLTGYVKFIARREPKERDNQGDIFISIAAYFSCFFCYDY